MSERNEAALRQLDSERNKRLLVNLPARVHGELAGKSSLGKADALACQVALAVAILLCLPIRRKNLSGLDLERHFVRRQDGTRQRVFIEIPAAETKTKEPLAFELSARTAALLDFYLERCRPALARHASAWLFPGDKPGCHKSPERVAANLVKLVYDRTGLRVSIHRFRHIVGKIVLDNDPSQFETVRRLLGHRSLDTTTAAYTGLDARVASRVLDRTLSALRGEEDDDA
jgi:integrase